MYFKGRFPKKQTMSDVKGLTVVFEKDLSHEATENVINAIKLIKNVMEVKEVKAERNDYYVELRVKQEIIKELLDLIEKVK